VTGEYLMKKTSAAHILILQTNNTQTKPLEDNELWAALDAVYNLPLQLVMFMGTYCAPDGCYRFNQRSSSLWTELKCEFTSFFVHIAHIATDLSSNFITLVGIWKFQIYEWHAIFFKVGNNWPERRSDAMRCICHSSCDK
jgi:hypothetical protein